ncbi:MAG TPA: Fic family protein [Solirubrobacteraceae bacterium]
MTERLRELDGLREQLGHEVGSSTPWMGALRRLARATSVESSTSIEGFHVSRADALALVNGTEQPDPEDLDRMAVSCYGRAMDHAGVMAGDPAFRWLDRVLLDLHFDACHFQLEANPGLWRTGPVGITGDDGRLVYQGPPAADMPTLMEEVADWLQSGDLEEHVVVRAAMAHLHVVSIHPFRDGNGRVSRIVQSLVLAREGLVSAEFGSIEEYLSDHTRAYYAALQAAHGGAYEPGDSDAGGWIEFCVEAHLVQARRRIAQIEQASVRWSLLERLIEERRWPDRLVIALEQSLIGGSDRALYANEAEVSPATASSDFRRLMDAGLIVRSGRTRGIRYEASDVLRAKVTAAVGR